MPKTKNVKDETAVEPKKKARSSNSRSKTKEPLSAETIKNNKIIESIVGQRIDIDAFWKRIFQKCIVFGTERNELRSKILLDFTRFPPSKFLTTAEILRRMGEKVTSERNDVLPSKKKQPILVSTKEEQLTDAEETAPEDDKTDNEHTDTAGTDPEPEHEDEDDDGEAEKNVTSQDKSKTKSTKNATGGGGGNTGNNKKSKVGKLIYTITLNTEAKTAIRCLIERIRWEMHEMLKQEHNQQDLKTLNTASPEGQAYIIRKIREAGFETSCVVEAALHIISKNPIGNTDMDDSHMNNAWDRDFGAEITNQFSNQIQNTKILNFTVALIVKFIKVIVDRSTKILWPRKSQGLNLACVETILLDYTDFIGSSQLQQQQQQPQNISNTLMEKMEKMEITSEEVASSNISHANIRKNPADFKNDAKSHSYPEPEILLHLIRRYIAIVVPPKKKRASKSSIKTTMNGLIIDSSSTHIVQSSINDENKKVNNDTSCSAGASASHTNSVVKKDVVKKETNKKQMNKQSPKKNNNNDDTDAGITDAGETADENNEEEKNVKPTKKAASKRITKNAKSSRLAGKNAALSNDELE